MSKTGYAEREAERKARETHRAKTIGVAGDKRESKPNAKSAGDAQSHAPPKKRSIQHAATVPSPTRKATYSSKRKTRALSFIDADTSCIQDLAEKSTFQLPEFFITDFWTKVLTGAPADSFNVLSSMSMRFWVKAFYTWKKLSQQGIAGANR